MRRSGLLYLVSFMVGLPLLGYAPLAGVAFMISMVALALILDIREM